MQHPRRNRTLGFNVVVSLAALLITAAPLAAQQATGAETQGAASSADQEMYSTGVAVTTPTAAQPAADASAPLPGPRLSPEMPRWQPVAPNLGGPSPTPVPPPAGNHTIVVSTLALVLIVVLVTILVVR